jgi:hypothetical protein
MKTIRQFSNEHRRKLSEAKLGKPSNRLGKHCSEETKKKISQAKIGIPAPWFIGIAKSNEHKRKLRLAKLKNLSRAKFDDGQVSPAYNPAACKAIEEYGKANGYNFQHAENGGEHHIKELGYWVDGYDKNKNAVIEVYEPAHTRRIEKDLRRQKEIQEHLGCEFIIINFK